MKYVIGLLLFVLLFSCSKDSSSKYTDTIIGSWQLTSGVPASSFEPCDFQGFITFKPDNTLLVIDACAFINSTGLWRITDNILTVSNDEIPIPADMQIVSMSDSKMTLKFMGDTENYVKVPDSQVKPIAADCKFCRQNSYENGVLKTSGTEVKYCGADLVRIETMPEVVVLGIVVKWECHSK